MQKENMKGLKEDMKVGKNKLRMGDGTLRVFKNQEARDAYERIAQAIKHGWKKARKYPNKKKV